MKKAIAMFLVLVTLAMMVLPVGAAFAVTNDGCDVCYVGLVDYCCTKGTFVRVETNTHQYGLPWNRKTCTVTWKFRWAVQKCLSCDHVFQTFGPHECVEVHSDCGKGTKSCCIYHMNFSGG